jgi:hypothetical protein
MPTGTFSAVFSIGGRSAPRGEETVLAGPAREGLALLQGLLLCGHCGRRLTVRYTGNGGIYPRYQCNWLRWESLGTSKDCLNIRCDLLDAAVAEEVLKALQPAELELALPALAELESRDQALARQWQMRIERAEYEAALAERGYMEVDPSQRLVASTLGRRWNDALLQLEDLKKQAAELQRQEARVATPEQKAKVLALARDLPRVWHAPTTQVKDRTRMLRLLLKDLTVEKLSPLQQLQVHIRWQGGACTSLSVPLPPKISRPRAVPGRASRQSSTIGSAFTRCRNRRPAPARRTRHCQGPSVHGEDRAVDSWVLSDSAGSIGGARGVERAATCQRRWGQPERGLL